MADCISTENTTEEPRWPRVAIVPNPASVTLESRLTEPSRIIQVSNQHTLNFQRGKTEHKGKLQCGICQFAENTCRLVPPACSSTGCSSSVHVYLLLGFSAVGGCGFSAAAREGRQAGWGPRVCKKKPLPGAWSSPRHWQHRAMPVAPSHAQANSLKSDLDQTSYLHVFSRAASSESSRKIIFFVYKGKFCGLPEANVLSGENRTSKTGPFLLPHIFLVRWEKVYFL